MSVIIGFSELMSNQEGLSDRSEENLEIIQRSARHLLALINDVLERLKTTGLYKSVPVIASTAANDAAKDDDLIALGAVAVCNKPLSPHRLREAVSLA